MRFRAIALSCALISALVVACSGDDDDGAPAATDDGGAGQDATVGPPGDLDSGHSGDSQAAPDLDAGLITDGGGNPDEDPDAGSVEVDSGIDAGACGPEKGNGAAIKSACASTRLKVSGGTITPGSYDLVGFTVQGSLAFCSTYTPESYAGRLDIEAAGASDFIFRERTTKTIGLVRASSKTFIVTPNGSFLDETQACGVVVTPSSWGYTVGIDKGGKATLLYVHSSGTATVRYLWKMR